MDHPGPEFATTSKRESLLPTPDRPINFGRYELLEVLGSGAMAQVFRARQRGPMGFNKEVALKLLRRDAAPRQRTEMEALINEARVGGRLRHPNLVEIYGCEVVDGSLCIAMEYVKGWTLDEVLWRCVEVGQNLPNDSVIDILRQVAAGLHSAHQACDENSVPLQLIHRDLKPQNIFLDLMGVVKIADFGLAKSSQSLYQTQSGEAKGSPLYMSPEQINGTKLDQRSDLFALGTIGIELVTGLWAFEGETIPQTFQKVLAVDCDEAMKSVQATAPMLQPLLSHLLKAQPSHRPTNAGVVEQQLRDLAGRVTTTTHTLPLVHALLGRAGLSEPYDALSRALSERGISMGETIAVPSDETWKVLPSLNKSPDITANSTQGSVPATPEPHMRALRGALIAASLAVVCAGIALLWSGSSDLEAPSIGELSPGFPVPDRSVGAPMTSGSPPSPAESIEVSVQQSSDAASQLRHTPQATAELWQTLVFNVEVPETEDWRITCHYRPTDGEMDGWRQAELEALGGGHYRASITITKLLSAGVTYFLKAEDGDGQMQRGLGSTSRTFKVTVEP